MGLYPKKIKIKICENFIKSVCTEYIEFEKIPAPHQNIEQNESIINFVEDTNLFLQHLQYYGAGEMFKVSYCKKWRRKHYNNILISLIFS